MKHNMTIYNTIEAYEKGYVHYAQDKEMEIESTCIIS
jgi:hypothetical protein